MSRAHLAGGESFHVSRKAECITRSLSHEKHQIRSPARRGNLPPSISHGALLRLHNVITYKKIIIHGEPYAVSAEPKLSQFQK